jgi:uncharacterized protein
MTEIKTEILDSILKDLKSFVIAFSGGVDSSFLVYKAMKAGKLKFIAVTIRTPYIPKREISEAVAFTEKYGIPHKIIDADFPELIRHNPQERCYLCKKSLFTKIESLALDNGYQYILDGTNADDSSDYRPGLKALKEMQVRSPLAEAGLTKKEIREQLFKEGLELWDKPAMACLLTRVPYETEITDGMLRMVEKAEEHLMEMGYPGTRVRIHGNIARIECLPGFLQKMVSDPVREKIVAELKKLGFRYISIDMEGYRTGSMN